MIYLRSFLGFYRTLAGAIVYELRHRTTKETP